MDSARTSSIDILRHPKKVHRFDAIIKASYAIKGIAMTEPSAAQPKNPLNIARVVVDPSSDVEMGDEDNNHVQDKTTGVDILDHFSDEEDEIDYSCYDSDLERFIDEAYNEARDVYNFNDELDSVCLDI
jgi:hypothetical protein